MSKRILDVLEKHAVDDTTRFSDDNKRLASLETWRWLVVGGAAAVGYAVYLGASFLAK